MLLTTGSFNPVHRAHIDIHRHARQLLEDGFPQLRVVASYISPSHDLYVQPKMRRSGRSQHFIPYPQRCEMIEVATQADPFISVDQV